MGNPKAGVAPLTKTRRLEINAARCPQNTKHFHRSAISATKATPVRFIELPVMMNVTKEMVRTKR
tara:strand:- start:243 stop:437 length:195 start_codon:yes stop_codon:yes gene_type:complete